ncbi:MAG: amidohydrolase family protein [Acetobacteraceae bacterium]
MASTLEGVILTPGGWVRGRLRHDASILAVEPRDDAPDRFILPGFVDLHVHGGGGADVMDGAEAVQRMARFHARHGTTGAARHHRHRARGRFAACGRGHRRGAA